MMWTGNRIYVMTTSKVARNEQKRVKLSIDLRTYEHVGEQLLVP
jgi:hypothetical protein